jgi:O-acetyl-ADP-ribose deacetylase (regulator of RNase III)
MYLNYSIFRSGDISALQVDAIVNSTNESMNESNPVSDRIFQRAGSELKEEINLDIRGKFSNT